MYVNTKTRLMCRQCILKIRLLFKTGFYVRPALIQDTTVIIISRERPVKKIKDRRPFLRV